MSVPYVILHILEHQRHSGNYLVRQLGCMVHSFRACTEDFYADMHNEGARTVVWLYGLTNRQFEGGEIFVKETFDEVANLLDARRGEDKS